MFKKITWYLIMVISIAGLGMFSAGFYRAIQVSSGSSAAQTSNVIKEETKAAETAGVHKDPNTIRILVMGDSIAKGTGDEKGKGISEYLQNYLKNQVPKDVLSENIGIDGLKGAGLLENLKSGRFNSLIAASDFIVISIGGNDMLALPSNNNIEMEEKFRETENEYLGNLKESLKIIRKINTNTCIAFVGLYNPYEGDASNDDTRWVNLWNYDTQQIIEADGKAVFIPTYDLFKFNLKRFIAADGLHPNSNGYQTLSSRISKSIENTLNMENKQPGR